MATLAEILRRQQVDLASLSPQRYPRLVESAVPFTACGPEDVEYHYQFGIDLFIAGVRAMAPDQHGGS